MSDEPAFQLDVGNSEMLKQSDLAAANAIFSGADLQGSCNQRLPRALGACGGKRAPKRHEDWGSRRVYDRSNAS